MTTTGMTAAISNADVDHKLLTDGLQQRIAGQLGLLIPLGLIAWVVAELPNRNMLWLLLGLQLAVQLFITASSQWLRSGLESRMADSGALAVRTMTWMLAEGAAGLVWGAVLLAVAADMGSSDAALTVWVTILVTMTVSLLLAAPISGIAFPLLTGFAIAVLIGPLLFPLDVTDHSTAALWFLILSLYVVVRAVYMRARESYRSRIEVERLSERLEQELARTSHLSRHDSLTGLLNRSALQADIAAWDVRGMAVILLDIDHFKAINDGHGHVCGDEVLAAVGGCLASMVTAHAPEALACRWGGEEFIVAVPGADEIEGAALAERLRAELAKTRKPDWPEKLSLTGSLGVASGAAVAFYEIFQQADNAMYAAKAAGRNRVVCAGGKDDGGGSARDAAYAA